MTARERTRLLAAPALLLLPALGLGGCKRGVPTHARASAATGPIDRVNPLPDPLPAIAARVNGEPIPTVRVASIARLREDRGTTETGPNAVALRESLRQLIVRELMFQEAVRRGLSPDALALERAYDALRAGESQEARWLKRLADEGLSKQELRQELRIQATVAELVRSLPGRAPEQVSEAEARTYFGAHAELGLLPERVKLRRIQVKVPSDAHDADRAAAQRRAEQLRDRLKAGEDFALLARTESQDESTRELGGDLGALGPGALRQSFEEVVAALQPGQVSEILVTSEGLELLKLEARLPAQQRPFEAVSALVRDAIVEDERRGAADELVHQLEAKARIEVYL